MTDSTEGNIVDVSTIFEHTLLWEPGHDTGGPVLLVQAHILSSRGTRITWITNQWCMCLWVSFLFKFQILGEYHWWWIKSILGYTYVAKLCNRRQSTSTNWMPPYFPFWKFKKKKLKLLVCGYFTPSLLAQIYSDIFVLVVCQFSTTSN